MHLFLSAGEPSGDEHAAELMAAVADRVPAVRFSGLGGPEMEAAGQDQAFRLTDLAVMGVLAVLPALRKFWDVYKLAKARIEADRPDAVVLVDFPGFHWHVARAAKKAGVPVIWYMPPQLWAWAPWRLRKAKRTVDAVISGLPFEADWYASRGVAVDRVPHPFFDEVARHPVYAAVVEELRPDVDRDGGDRVVAVLPGSRGGEVAKNFPVQLIAMRRVAAEHPGVRFEVACHREHQAESCRRMLAEACSQFGPLPGVRFHVGRTSEVVEAAEMALMVSGSVSLELLARRTPAVVCYRCGPVMYGLACALLTVDHFSLPNLMAGREVMPETAFVTRKRRHAAKMATVLSRWLSSPAELAAVRAQLDAVASEVDRPGGAAEAAAAVLRRTGVSREAARVAA